MINQRNSMSKKSNKRAMNMKDNNVGCLAGLIRLFHFGKHHSTPKLLPYRTDQISDENGHGGNTLPKQSKGKKENIDPGGLKNVSGKVSSTKDSNKKEILMKHTAEKTSGYNVDSENKTKTVTSQDNKFGSNDWNQDSMLSQSAWSDLKVSLCKEENIDNGKLGKHGDIHEKGPKKMIVKYFDPKQIKTIDAFQPSRFNPKKSSSHTVQQIVVLKPNKQHEEHGHSSRFTLKDIRGRMKEMKGEDKIKPSTIKMDSLLHKIPYGSPKDIKLNEKATNTVQSKKLATLLQRQEEEPNVDNSRRSISYDEGRKRLADMLHIDYRVDKISSPRKPPRSLGRILSLPAGFDSPSPMFSPRSSIEINDCSPLISVDKHTEAIQPKMLFDTEDGLKGKDYWMDFSADELCCDCETCKEGVTRNVSDFPPEALESTAYNQEKDSISLSIVEHIPDDDESISKQRWLKPLRSALEGSGLNYNTELLDNLLDPSVSDELETKYRHLNIESNLFLDYITEVSTEICLKFSCSSNPYISLIKPNIRPTPTKETFMHELCEGVERFIHKDFPSTVEHITKIDLDHEAWLNIRADIEDVVIEVEDEILDYIMEETVLELSNSIQAF